MRSSLLEHYQVNKLGIYCCVVVTAVRKQVSGRRVLLRCTLLRIWRMQSSSMSDDCTSCLRCCGGKYCVCYTCERFWSLVTGLRVSADQRVLLPRSKV